ncbi:hypothetical protein GCM10011586_27880 [Silvibacterium dinghuense]|nr:hypothetical protein GCM10011586_27880 [Silvibacterium dinghuense]
MRIEKAGLTARAGFPLPWEPSGARPDMVWSESIDVCSWPPYTVAPVWSAVDNVVGASNVMEEKGDVIRSPWVTDLMTVGDSAVNETCAWVCTVTNKSTP